MTLEMHPKAPQSKKSKTLHDFFRPEHRAQQGSSSSLSSPPLTPISTAVPGISVRPLFISPAEESQILSFLATQNWRTDLSRRTIHYGGTYCHLPSRRASPTTKKRIESTIVTAPPIPSELTFLIDRMLTLKLYVSTHLPTHIIVNEYLPTQGISAHVESFRFDEPVCALTLGDGDYLRFHELVEADDGSVRSGKAQKAERTGRKVDVWMPSRSLLVTTGPGRWRWQHEVVRGRKRGMGEDWKRTSLTFRVARNLQ